LTVIEGWQSGSSGRVPAWQVWGIEFKFQYHKRKRKKSYWENSISGSGYHFYYKHIPTINTSNTLLSTPYLPDLIVFPLFLWLAETVVLYNTKTACTVPKLIIHSQRSYKETTLYSRNCII
jgi:hypothetical protein